MHLPRAAQAEIASSKKTFASARLFNVIEPSPPSPPTHSHARNDVLRGPDGNAVATLGGSISPTTRTKAQLSLLRYGND